MRPGDTLETRVEVLETRESKSRPDRGIIRLMFRTSVGETLVSSFSTTTFLRRRPVSPSTEDAA